MKNIRLIQAIGSKGGGGAESFFSRLSLSLNQEKCINQHLLVRPNKTRDAFYKKNNLSYTPINFGNYYFDIKSHLLFKSHIKTFNPDIVLTWMNRATQFCPNPKKKSFLHIARLGGYYNLKYYKNCDYLVGNTPMIVDYLIRQGWPKEKAIYIPNFVPENQSSPYDKKEFSKEKKLPLLLSIGRLHENKGFDTLIHSMKKVPEGQLLIAGDGPLRENLEDLVQNLKLENRIKFLGWREDTNKLLKTADIFICPSRHEPLGNVVLEAWASKKPVIASKSHGPSMLIKHKTSGLLFDIDNIENLASTINKLIKNKEQQEKLSLEGFKRLQENFSQEVVTKKYLKLFKDITN